MEIIQVIEIANYAWGFDWIGLLLVSIGIILFIFGITDLCPNEFESIIVAILILCTRLYELIVAIVLIILGAFVGNYVQQNKEEVKEKVKGFIDRL